MTLCIFDTLQPDIAYRGIERNMYIFVVSSPQLPSQTQAIRHYLRPLAFSVK